jgi:hypothetical protein
LEGGYLHFWGGNTFVAVPVDEQLEKRALLYIQSATRWKREEGAKVLAHFRSDENVTRLKSLLNDPGYYVYEWAEWNRGVESRSFQIRQAAYATLTEWGVNVKKPIFTERVERFDLARSVSVAPGENATAALKVFERFPNLEHIDFSGGRLSEAQLKSLARFKRLRELNLKSSRVTDAWLAHLAAFKELRSLNLEATDVTDAGMAALTRLPNLEELFLERTKVSTVGVSELVRMMSLKGIRLDPSEVTDTTLQLLRGRNKLHLFYEARAERPDDYPGWRPDPRPSSMQEVVRFDLSGTRVTDAGLMELVVLPRLKSVTITGTQTTEAGVRRFRKALPNCAVEGN